MLFMNLKDDRDHPYPMWVLPYGAIAEINAEKKTVSLLG